MQTTKENPPAGTDGQKSKTNSKPDYNLFPNTGATIQFSQEIYDPDGIQLHITLESLIVNITDPKGNTIKFSAYLVPELRASLLEVEGKFWRGLSREQI